MLSIRCLWTLAALLLLCLSAAVARAQTWPGDELKLLPNDGAAAQLFGHSIAIDNGVVAVGARNDDDNGAFSGSAYLFDAATGAQLAKLLPNDGAFEDNFGWSIAIDNGVVAVGAIFDDDNGPNSGSAYLFDAVAGTQLAKLLPNDGAAAQLFGHSIAIDNGIVAVGARNDDDNGLFSGSVYLFDAATGTQLAKLLPTDGAFEDNFGWSIAMDNGIVAVGAIFDDDNGPNSGSAYLFDAATGTQLLKLLPTDGAAAHLFGNSIAIDNGVVAVGARNDDDNGAFSGSAYLFDAATGAQLLKLLPSDGAFEDNFGWSIAMANGIVAVGAIFDDYAYMNSGAVYLFDAATGVQLLKVRDQDFGEAAAEFGWSIAIDNGRVVVGANRADDNGPDSGSAYRYSLTLRDSDGDGLSDGDEVNITGTDPNNPDTDGDGTSDYDEDTDADGLSDGFEVTYGSGTDPFDAAGDADSDGLSDADELLVYGTLVFIADSDGDGLLDGQEVFITMTDPLNRDTDENGQPDYYEDSDGDFLYDGDELNIYGTDPRLSDSDNDGLDDGVEINTTSTDPLSPDTDGDGTSDYDEDTDADGLSDGDEINTYGSDPFNTDSDGDGLIDGDEVNTYATDPADADTDNDELDDSEEINVHGTDPLNRDTDGDRLSDGLEIFYGTNPLNPDTDGDGLSDWAEIFFLNTVTDPLNPDTDGDGTNDYDEDSDGDGLTNGDEVDTYGTHPNFPDSDFGGTSDGQEILDGTNPRDPRDDIPPCPADTNNDGILDNGDVIAFVSLFLTGDLAADTNADGILDNGDIIAFVSLFLAGC